jgi:hypothetical protein
MINKCNQNHKIVFHITGMDAIKKAKDNQA